MRIFSAVLAAMSAALSVAARSADKPVNYDETRVGDYSLEDPLRFVDGRKVGSKDDWAARRQEIVGIFEREMFGRTPPNPEVLDTELLDDKVAVAGFGIRRRYRMRFAAGAQGPSVEWIVWIPRHAKHPVPVILFLNYRGNHELVTDSDIPIQSGWVRSRPMTDGHQASSRTRGVFQDQNSDDILPLQMLLARGYAVMSACYAEVSPDPDEGDREFSQDAFAYTGVFNLWGQRDAARTDDITSLGAWAWALSRGLDLAERIPEVDARRSVVTGCSRLGKAALLAASRDERFAVCAPVQTGGGGAPLAKRNYGENVSTMTRMFRHWYCRAYDRYREDPAATMRFDQHLLLASIAPRALLVMGFDSKWFDPRGEFLACRAASPAWTFFGAKGLPAVNWPDPYDRSAIGPELGYVRRTEGHGLSGYEWTWMIDFADGVWKDKDGSDVDTLTKETSLIQRRINAAHESGGGRVSIAPGRHLTGGLRLKSNVELHLEKGAELVFSDDPQDYLPSVRISFEGTECYGYSSLVYASEATNVAITGEGRLVARHDFWKTWMGWRKPSTQKTWNKLVAEWGANDVPVENRRLLDEEGHEFRPHFFHFNRCRNVRLDGFAMRGSPFWMIHLYLCDGAIVRNLDVSAFDEDGFAMNNSDGIDIEASRNVLVEGCSFTQNDDGIVIKSGRNRDGRRVGVPTENVTVRNCTVRKGHGLLVIGSEISGGVSNILMESCQITGEAHRLLYIKTARPRGGFVRNVTVRDVTADKVGQEVLAINTSYVLFDVEKELDCRPVTHVEGVLLSGVRCGQADRLYAIEGDPLDPVAEVCLEDVVVDRLSARPSVIENAIGVVINGKIMPDPALTPFRKEHW